MDPESGTLVNVGDNLTYTLSFANVGAADIPVDYTDHMADILDNAELTGDVTAHDGLTTTGPTDGQLHITGTIKAGETATVVYTVLVITYDAQGSHQVANFLTPTGQQPPTQCLETSNLCTINPITPPLIPMNLPSDGSAPHADAVTPAPYVPQQDLPNTGNSISLAIVIAAGTSLFLGATLLRIGRRRNNKPNQGTQ